MKYIDAEKLKAEIERKKAPFKKDIDDNVYPTYLCALMDFEDLIDSLQQEQQEDLDADIEMEWDSFNKHLAEYGEESEDVAWINWYSFNELARHFYELGIKARKEG